jgi:hypothetical protein
VRAPATAKLGAILSLAGALGCNAAFGQAAHYPGAWLDQAATSQETAAAAQRGLAHVVVYASNDRIERVEAFYRQFLQPLPAPGLGGARYCLDRVMRPEDCRRFVELWESAGGSRIRSYELR